MAERQAALAYATIRSTPWSACEFASDTHPTLIALLVGPALFGVVLAAPLEGLTAPAHRLAAVFVWVVAYWVTEAIPLPATSLLGSVLCIVLGVAPAGTVLPPTPTPSSSCSSAASSWPRP